MEWTLFLLLLLCPLMMIICMKGMGGHKHHSSHSSSNLDKKMSKLEIENETLKKEIDKLSSLIKKGS
ncbi:DUF2933 domain-containing protein [Ferdinandcohnia sp. SAFN-114]|uniref:DUF2933 domain-containing protein n=1 Tax=Ferdinandcohnia sp. SAFN-114 TaxID=3387275 RepID=UPI003F80C8E0